MLDERQTLYENEFQQRIEEVQKVIIKVLTSTDLPVVKGKRNDNIVEQARLMTSLKFGKVSAEYFPDKGRRIMRTRKNKTSRAAKKIHMSKAETEGEVEAVMKNYVPTNVINAYESDEGANRTLVYVAPEWIEAEPQWSNIRNYINVSLSRLNVSDSVNALLKKGFNVISINDWLKESSLKIITPITKKPKCVKLKDEMTGFRLLWGDADFLRSIDLREAGVINMLNVAEFYGDEGDKLKSLVTDEGQGYFMKSFYRVDMKIALLRRMKNELASGMMINEKDTLIATIEMMKWIKGTNLYLDKRRGQLIINSLNALLYAYKQILDYYGKDGWFTSKPTEREVLYTVSADIFAFKRMQIFNNYAFQLLTYSDEIPDEFIEQSLMYAIFAIREPVMATMELRSIMNLGINHIGTQSEENYVVYYEPVNYEESHPSLVYRGFKKEKKKPFLISNDTFDESINDEIGKFYKRMPSYIGLYDEFIKISMNTRKCSIGRVSALIYSFVTATPTMSGFITKDLLSSHVKVCEPILAKVVEPDKDIKVAFKNLMLASIKMFPPNTSDNALHSMFQLIKDTSSSMDINDDVHVNLKIPNWNVRTGEIKQISANITLTSKKKNIAIIRAHEMLESTAWMENRVVGTGSRKVRGSAKARNICPESFETLTAQHMVVGRINQMMLSKSEVGSENVRIAQGVPSSAPHVVASKVFASSSDERAIVVDLDAASFDKTQHQMRRLQLEGLYEGVIEGTRQLVSNERRLGYANVAELATGLFKEKMRFEDVRFYNQDTVFGDIEIMYPGNKSGSLDTTNVNNAVENHVFEYIKRRFEQDKDELMEKFDRTGRYKFIRMTANFLGDDYKSQLIFENEIPDDEEFIRAVIELISKYIDEGPLKWGMEIHKEKGAVGWGASNYIKVSTFLGQYHANQPLSPHDSEKASNSKMQVALKVASFVDIMKLAALRGKDLGRLDVYMMSQLGTFAKYRFYGLHMIPHPSIVRASGHMICAPNCNMNLYSMFMNRGYTSALYKTAVNRNDNIIRGFKAITSGLAHDINFVNSSQLLRNQYATTGALPKDLEMYNADNILALTLSMTAGSKIDNSSRNLLEAAAIASVLNGKAFKEWKIATSVLLSLKVFERLPLVATGPYPGISKRMMSGIHRRGLKSKISVIANSKSTLLRVINKLVESKTLPKTIDISVLMGMYVHKPSNIFKILNYYGVSSEEQKTIMVTLTTLSVTDRDDLYLRDASSYSTVSSLIKLEDDDVREILNVSQKEMSTTDKIICNIIIKTTVFLLLNFGVKVLKMDYKYTDGSLDIFLISKTFKDDISIYMVASHAPSTTRQGVPESHVPDTTRHATPVPYARDTKGHVRISNNTIIKFVT